MASIVCEEDLSDEFDVFGIELENSDCIDKLKELCVTYRLDASDIATEWVAFSQSKKIQSLCAGSLEMFERERLSKKTPKTPKTSTSKNSSVIYDLNTIDQGVDDDEAVALYESYSTLTPKAKTTGGQKRQLTPENVPLKRFTGSSRSPVIPFSPASFSPAGQNTPSQKYASRTNAGDVVCSFGGSDNAVWTGQGQGCSIHSYDSSADLPERFKYMFQKLTDKAFVLNDLIEDMSSELKQTHNIVDLAHVALPTQEPVCVVGRICCDSNGKLNSKSVLLEGSRETSAGKTIPLDLSQLPSYSLFPGQIVAVEGVNSTGNMFVASKIFENVCVPPPATSVKTENVPLSLVVAAGPFTTSDTLTYDPLADFLKYIHRDKPDLCILLGPFVDIKNEEIEKCSLTCSYTDLFQSRLQQIVSITERINCHLVVVPSQRDIHHDSVYPQPPFNMPNLQAKNVQFVSDPCTLVINNTVFSITSTDILFHLGAEEVSFPPGSADRLGRLTNHLLMQHSYYPLYPPSEEVCVDFDHFEQAGRIPVKPHVLIVPSDLRYFIKDIKGCCCVNPGRLAKGQVGGTYCRLVITPSGSQSPNIAAQVIRV
ncbi:DNA polymerase alpha subunit B-like [Gigantopelta aegis]|uniref:DNA polymerase alpha subunit B-like n=1 Tax=Gigantopelta aegis TaxID=1735272 RepID=UPI001B88900B|nr:DNA polymerase alpha subunit B-like [Gigantopelta aegis]